MAEGVFQAELQCHLWIPYPTYTRKVTVLELEVLWNQRGLMRGSKTLEKLAARDMTQICKSLDMLERVRETPGNEILGARRPEDGDRFRYTLL